MYYTRINLYVWKQTDKIPVAPGFQERFQPSGELSLVEATRGVQKPHGAHLTLRADTGAKVNQWWQMEVGRERREEGGYGAGRESTGCCGNSDRTAKAKGLVRTLPEG